MQKSYLRLETDPVTGKRHSLLAGLEDAPRIINGARRIEVKATRPFPNPPLTLIPTYPDLPMERVFPRVLKTDLPQVFLIEFEMGSARVSRAESGVSPDSLAENRQSFRRDAENRTPEARAPRVVYFPWDIDRTFWEVLAVDHFKLLRDVVDWATNEEPLISVNGPGVLDVTVWRQKASLAVHLVNLTNPMMMKGPVRELIPVGEQKVRLRLPEGAQAKRICLLAAGRSPRVDHAGQYLSITVPSVLDHEIIAIDH